MLKSLLRGRVSASPAAWSRRACCAPALTTRLFHTSLANRQPDAPSPSTPPMPTTSPSFRGLVSKYGWIPIAGFGSIIALSKELLILNEEILVLGTFTLTVYALYSQIGDSVSSYLEERSKKIGEEMTAAMDDNVKEIDAAIEAHSSVLTLSDEIHALYTHQIELMDRYVQAMPQKLKSEITSQVERRLALLAEKEKAVADSMQNTLADAAAAHVRRYFETAPPLVKNQILQKSIAQMASVGKRTQANAKGSGAQTNEDDPVRDQFLQYFDGFSQRVTENTGKQVPLTSEQKAEWVQNFEDLLRRDPNLKGLKVDVPDHVTLS